MGGQADALRRGFWEKGGETGSGRERSLTGGHTCPNADTPSCCRTWYAAAGVSFHPHSSQKADKSEHQSYRHIWLKLESMKLGHFSGGVGRNASYYIALRPGCSVLWTLCVFPSEIASHPLYSKLKLLIKMLQTLRDQKKVRSGSAIQPVMQSPQSRVPSTEWNFWKGRFLRGTITLHLFR